MSFDNYYLEIKEKIAEIARQNGREANEITLVAVSKGHSQEKITSVYQKGCHDFGENRVQEALRKIPSVPSDIHWHFIGTLQRNKVNKIIGKFKLIHSIDSFELAQKISQSSLEKGLITPMLLQVNTSGETSKHGLRGDSWLHYFEELLKLPAISIEGLMTIAPYVENKKIIRSCFSDLRKWRDAFASIAGRRCSLHHLSMGMSYDYRIAIEEGATILRIGAAIFQGKR
ncbi:MAG TPA: YggS family pyridoxal phosphate-dependent enzyme [Waddliaceae bacterium]